MAFLFVLILFVVLLVFFLNKAAKISETSNEIERQAQKEPYMPD